MMMGMGMSSRGWLAGLLVVLSGCGGHRGTAGSDAATRVVVYSAQDREFGEPILREYARRTGVEVLPKFDVESTKTVGLANDIIAERSRPRCDLFWNNEILNTLRLKERGLLAPFQPSHADELPATFRARDGTWYGFAGRARVLIVNTKTIAEADRPRGIRDLLDPKWKGKIGIAKPLFGTTATHAACLFAAWGDEPAQSVLPRAEGQRRAGPLGEQAGRHRRRVGADRLRAHRHRRRHRRGRGRQPGRHRLPRPQARRAGDALHPQHAGDRQGVPAPRGGEGPGRLPAQPDDRGRAGRRPQRRRSHC